MDLFPFTLKGIDGAAFDGNGMEPEKPLVGSVFTFLQCLTTEAQSCDVAEGDLFREMSKLVGARVQEDLRTRMLLKISSVKSYCGLVDWLLRYMR